MAAGRFSEAQARRQDPRAVQNDDVARADQRRKIVDASMPDGARRVGGVEQPSRIAGLKWDLGNGRNRKYIIKCAVWAVAGRHDVAA